MKIVILTIILLILAISAIINIFTTLVFSDYSSYIGLAIILALLLVFSASVYFLYSNENWYFQTLSIISLVIFMLGATFFPSIYSQYKVNNSFFEEVAAIEKAALITDKEAIDIFFEDEKVKKKIMNAFGLKDTKEYNEFIKTQINIEGSDELKTSFDIVDPKTDKNIVTYFETTDIDIFVNNKNDLQVIAMIALINNQRKIEIYGVNKVSKDILSEKPVAMETLRKYQRGKH